MNHLASVFSDDYPPSNPPNPFTMATRSLDDKRRHVQVLPERVGAVSQDCWRQRRQGSLTGYLQVSNSEFPGHYPGEDHAWNLNKFKEVSLEAG